MENIVMPPDLTEGYPSKGRCLGPAWTKAWALLSDRPDEWKDGPELWAQVSEAQAEAGLPIHVDTLRNLFSRMVRYGILERGRQKVETPKGLREHTFFRIAEEV
jgi:hypothetical protein